MNISALRSFAAFFVALTIGSTFHAWIPLQVYSMQATEMNDIKIIRPLAFDCLELTRGPECFLYFYILPKKSVNLGFEFFVTAINAVPNFVQALPTDNKMTENVTRVVVTHRAQVWFHTDKTTLLQLKATQTKNS